MLNYNKMDEVLNNLETQVDNFKNIVEIQARLEGVLGELSQAHSEIKNEREKSERFVVSVEGLESAHKAIDDKIETALQDYKEIHSNIELIEAEIEKNASEISELQSESKRSLQEIYSLSVKNEKALSTIENKINSFSREMGISVFAIIVCLLVSITMIVFFGLIV